MGNKARPFTIKVPVGEKPVSWTEFHTTSRGGSTYIWYKSTTGQAQVILPSYFRPPSGWIRGDKVQHPDLDEWEEVIDNGEEYKDLRLRRKDIQKAKRLARLAAKANPVRDAIEESSLPDEDKPKTKKTS